MPLDPNLKAMLEQMEAMGAPPVHSLSVAEARASMDAMVAMMGPGEDVASVEDRIIEAGGQTLPVRIYRPEGLGDGPAPTLVFYHGGGFVIGGLMSHDRDCRALANRDSARSSPSTTGWRRSTRTRPPPTMPPPRSRRSSPTPASSASTSSVWRSAATPLAATSPRGSPCTPAMPASRSGSSC